MRNLWAVQASPDRGSASRMRAGAVAAVTVTMAVAAHSGSGGPAPDATSVLLLLGLSAVLATAARSVPGLSTGATGLVVLLTAGQLVAHLMLSVSAHHHHGVMGSAMLGAHVVAVGVCALLVALAERIGPRCVAALGRVLPRLLCPTPTSGVLPWFVLGGDVPTQRSAVIAVSVGRRGPPRV